MGYCSLRVIERPIVEPVSLDDAKAHLRIDHDSDDGLIAAYTAVARSRAEQFMNRALITQTLCYTMSPAQPIFAQPGALVNPIIFITPIIWPTISGAPISLPMSPVQSIVSVSQRLRDGTTAALTSGTDFYGDTTNEPGRVSLNGRWQPAGSDLAITYVAGYGDTPDAVPISIVHAIKLMLTYFYEHRGDDEVEMPQASKMLMWPERLVGFA